MIGSGSSNESDIKLAEKILDGAGGSLKNLASMSQTELCHFNGMGMATSSMVMAAMELALRQSVAATVRYKMVYLYKKAGHAKGFFGMGN